MTLVVGEDDDWRVVDAPIWETWSDIDGHDGDIDVEIVLIFLEHKLYCVAKPLFYLYERGPRRYKFSRGILPHFRGLVAKIHFFAVF